MAFWQPQSAYIKFVFGFGRGSAPDPAGGAYDASPDPLVGWGGETPSPFRTPSMPSASRHSTRSVSASLQPPTFKSLATYVLNNIDVDITIIYSQKYVHGIHRARV